jgi:dephospho-CoA kinase
MTDNKIIFGFVGQMASGKDTAADYLEEKYNGKNFSFSDMLGDVLKRYHLELNRDNYIKASEAMREYFGDEILSKTMAEDIKKDKHTIISISNVRRQNDVKFLSDLPGFILVRIDADSKIRYDRLTHRGEKSDDNNKTYEQFLEDHKRSTEITIEEIANQASENINNNSSLEDLQKQLDALVKKYEN